MATNPSPILKVTSVFIGLASHYKSYILARSNQPIDGCETILIAYDRLMGVS